MSRRHQTAVVRLLRDAAAVPLKAPVKLSAKEAQVLTALSSPEMLPLECTHAYSSVSSVAVYELVA